MKHRTKAPHTPERVRIRIWVGDNAGLIHEVSATFYKRLVAWSCESNAHTIELM